jgi:hypothetical protein
MEKMKIRTGFVSNSSSSSFILFYNDVESISYVKKDADNVYCIGSCRDNESFDFFKLDKDMIKFMKENELFVKKFYFQFAYVYKMIRDGWENPTRKEHLSGLPELFLVKGIEVNNWSTGGLRDLIRNYSQDTREADQWFKLAGLPSTEKQEKASKKYYKELESKMGYYTPESFNNKEEIEVQPKKKRKTK